MRYANLIALIPLICISTVAHTKNDASSDFASGPTSTFGQIDRIIANTKKRTDMVSGTAVIVVKDDQVVHEGYFGKADVEAGVRVDKETTFYIASTTKAFFALAVLLAEERGDLKPTTTLQELFPDLKFEHIDAGLVTVQQLMTHTSGIDNESLTWAASYTGLHDANSRRKMIAASYVNKKAPSGEFEYSNIGYNILAIWFDEFYGQDWRDTLKETVLMPLKMDHTSGYISEGKRRNWAMAKPYSYKVSDGKKSVYLNKNDKTMYSVGLISTALDTARFVIATMNDGAINGEQVFPKKVVQSQREQQVVADGGYFDGYAWGWMTKMRGGEPVRFHTGGFSGASAHLSYLPKKKIGLVILHNENGLKANYLSGIIEDAVYGKLLDEPQNKVLAEVEADVDKLVTLSKRTRATLAHANEARLLTAWNLSFNPSEYTGTYSHPHSGEIIIALNAEGRFDLRWGVLKGTGYPNGETNTIEVDFRPGSFDALLFQTNESKVISLKFNGISFKKRDK